MRKLLPYKKDKRKSIDLKIPIPLVGGIQNAKLAEWQLDALLTSGRQQYPNKEEPMVAKGNSMREGVKKAGSSISTFEPRAQAALPTRPISSPPVLAMPNPRRLLLPPDLVLRGEDLDKTEIETVTSRSDEDTHSKDVVFLWPHNWKEIPSYTQEQRTPGTGDSNDLWASGSEDYVSALQSPLVSEDDQIINFTHPSSEDNHSTPRAQRQLLNSMRGRAKEKGQPVQPSVVAQQPPQPLRYEQQQQQQNTISLEDLKQQVDMIQLQRVKERHEWERREMEHRKREKEMLNRIQDTQRRVERALANRSNHNNVQNGIANSSSSSSSNTAATNTNKTNGTAFSHRPYATREPPMEDEDVLQRYDYYYHYYPYMQREKRQQQQQTRSLRRSSVPGSTEGDYHSAMEEFPDAAHREKQKQRQDDIDSDSDDDAENDNEEHVMDQPRRCRHPYVNEDGIHYATFPSHVRRPRPHAYMTPSAAAVHRGGGRMPPPQMLMFDDWPAWPPPPPLFPPRHHGFGPSAPTTPSAAYPESYQGEYCPFPYPILNTSSSSSRMHHRSAITPSVPVPMFHHHHSADGPPPPPPASMGYR